MFSFENLFESFVVDIIKMAIFAILALVGYHLYQKRRYGGWVAVLRHGDREIDRQELGVETAQAWLKDSWARKLGLKSLCADNKVFLNISVLKISHVDYKNKLFVVRAEENPQPEAKPSPKDSPAKVTGAAG